MMVGRVARPACLEGRAWLGIRWTWPTKRLKSHRPGTNDEHAGGASFDFEAYQMIALLGLARFIKIEMGAETLAMM